MKTARKLSKTCFRAVLGLARICDDLLLPSAALQNVGLYRSLLPSFTPLSWIATGGHSYLSGLVNLINLLVFSFNRNRVQAPSASHRKAFWYINIVPGSLCCRFWRRASPRRFVASMTKKVEASEQELAEALRPKKKEKLARPEYCMVCGRGFCKECAPAGGPNRENTFSVYQTLFHTNVVSTVSSVCKRVSDKVRIQSGRLKGNVPSPGGWRSAVRHSSAACHFCSVLCVQCTMHAILS